MSSEMIEVVIDSVRVNLISPQRLVILRAVNSGLFLPIWVGPYEAEAITVALNEIEMIRPLTHDLLKNIITTFNARVVRTEIIAIRDETFYGNIVLEGADGQQINIDARPSDAIAIAIRTHTPILVDAAVLEAAGRAPEKDILDKTLSPESAETEGAIPGTPDKNEEKRLSVFEDFLTSLGDEPDKENTGKSDTE